MASRSFREDNFLPVFVSVGVFECRYATYSRLSVVWYFCSPAMAVSHQNNFSVDDLNRKCHTEGKNGSNLERHSSDIAKRICVWKCL